MSVRLHFALQQILGLNGEVAKGLGYDHVMVGKVKISLDEQHAFHDLSGEPSDAEYPADFDIRLVQEISSHTYFQALAARRTGEYRHKSAVGILEMTSDKTPKYMLKITATDLEDMRVLYRDIRQGNIWPDIDYEAEMVPPPARHLRQLLREAWAIICRDVHARFNRA